MLLRPTKKLIINTDINILSNLPDYSYLKSFFEAHITGEKESSQESGEFKTVKSLKRFDSAVTKSFLTFKNNEIEKVLIGAYKSEGISENVLILLFWNLSFNNDLFNYLNLNVYFPALYSGRVSLKTLEVQACLRELQELNADSKSWSGTTLTETSSSYLRILKKMHLMEGIGGTKTIKSPYLSDKTFVLFTYLIKAIEERSNILDSNWVHYSFCEKPVFIERIIQKKFAKYFDITYSGDKLTITPTLPYSEIYNALK